MIKTKVKYFYLFLLFSAAIFAQNEKYIELIHADSLVGKEVNGEPVRLLIGNVNLIQDDIIIFCDKATQFLQGNRAELEGNVKVKQKNVTILAPSGVYEGTKKLAYGKNGIALNDGKVTLTASYGSYDFRNKRADFFGNVLLTDDSSTVRSAELIYYSEQGKAVATHNVSIEQNSDIIYSDTLVYFRYTRFSIADGEVKIVSRKNNLEIFGNHLENYDNQKKTFLKGNVLLLQVDTTSKSGDTLLISCDSLETQRLKAENYFAYGSVKMWKNGFSSQNDITLFNRGDNRIVTYRTADSSAPPIFWQDANQISGDSVVFYTYKDKIKEAEIFLNGFIINRDSLNAERYNQLNSDYLKIYFAGEEISKVVLSGKSLSIYYSYEEERPNGLNKSSADSMVISFLNRQVNSIDLFGTPEGEYHPEELIISKEKEFLLGGFRWYEKKFNKETLLNKRNLISKKE